MFALLFSALLTAHAITDQFCVFKSESGELVDFFKAPETLNEIFKITSLSKTGAQVLARGRELIQSGELDVKLVPTGFILKNFKHPAYGVFVPKQDRDPGSLFFEMDTVLIETSSESKGIALVRTLVHEMTHAIDREDRAQQNELVKQKDFYQVQLLTVKMEKNGYNTAARAMRELKDLSQCNKAIIDREDTAFEIRAWSDEDVIFFYNLRLLKDQLVSPGYKELFK
jgi:hypothetical protein